MFRLIARVLRIVDRAAARDAFEAHEIATRDAVARDAGF